MENPGRSITGSATRYRSLRMSMSHFVMDWKVTSYGKYHRLRHDLGDKMDDITTICDDALIMAEPQHLDAVVKAFAAGMAGMTTMPNMRDLYQ